MFRQAVPDSRDRLRRATLPSFRRTPVNNEEEPIWKFAALLVAAVGAGSGLHALAQGRMDARPTVTPIASSSSNGISFAWFYDATERTVYVCRAGQGKGDTVECRARATLP